MRTQFLPFHVPSISALDIESVVDTLRSGWITTGPKTQQFERDFAAFLGVRHAIAVNSGTAALHLALYAVGVREGDEVIVPTMTFAATAEVVSYLRAIPRLIDCRPDTLNIDVAQVERAMSPRTKALIPVHFGGQPCEMDGILDLARTCNVAVVEDAAHALPASYRKRAVGTLGDIGCFSFYATKTITTGEGGMITTADDSYADRMRLMSLHGISRDAWKRYFAEGSWHYEILQPGYKYNLTDIAAALGIEQLKRCERFREARRRIAARYDEAFEGLPEISTPARTAESDHAWHLYVIQLKLEQLRITRAEFIARLKAENIGCAVHFIPLHLHPYYRQAFGYESSHFPVASALSERIVSLPIYPKMSDADVGDVIGAVTKIVRAHRR